MKYSDQMVDWLVEDGYTHCFFVAGGNIMHLLDSVRSRMTCVPVVHEVAAGIAAEYFNEVSGAQGPRAFALVTAGPGLTNILTAMAGAYLESRDLLVVGGQVKSSDLTGGHLRQRGIQEVDGVALAAPVSVRTLQVTRPLPKADLMDAVAAGRRGRKGPVLLEVCLDAQAAEAIEDIAAAPVPGFDRVVPPDHAVNETLRLLETARRPVILIGGGLDRETAAGLLPGLTDLSVPLMTTWNAADRVPSDHALYFGRPNTWGMRWSNVLLQQADLVIAVGTRLGLQQSGFDWRGFAPMATVVQVDIDPAELAKGHPHIDLAIEGDAGLFLQELVGRARDAAGVAEALPGWQEWFDFGRTVRAALPLDDAGNSHDPGYVSPHQLVIELAELLDPLDLIIPCSSGGAFTVMMQVFHQKAGQLIATDKGLASMGYGLSAAIGASLRYPGRRTVLVEGDGGFAQNLQELGTVAAQQLNLKIFIFANEGYASIRMTQRNYFGGAYLGCDTATGLGLPDWTVLFAAYGIPTRVLSPEKPFDEATRDLLGTEGPAAFIVPIDPEQTYYPKINSRVTPEGGMESSPLHQMYPPLDPQEEALVLRYLQEMERT